MMIGSREVIHHLSGRWGAASMAAGHSPFSGAAVSTGTPTRRLEPRVEERKICTYELCESIDDQAVVIQQGEVFTLNRSQHGILILMGQAPRHTQLIELHIPESRWRHSMNLFQVQWSNPIRVEDQGELFLVGCRRTFGPSFYWAF